MVEKHTLYVGTVERSGDGMLWQDDRKVVEFVGTDLAFRTEPGKDKTRGTEQTLYQSEGGRFVVHERSWSSWQGEPTTFAVIYATPDDLAPTGRFADLGALLYEEE